MTTDSTTPQTDGSMPAMLFIKAAEIVDGHQAHVRASDEGGCDR